MLVGRVDLGGSFQACSASYSCTEDAMARSIVRLECENEELRAEVALLREERNILARAKAAVTEGGTGNSKVERPEPSPHLSYWELSRQRDNMRFALHKIADAVRYGFKHGSKSTEEIKVR
jgi:hypothetical protein